MKINDTYPYVSLNVTDRSRCLEECLEINCTMFAYDRKDDNEPDDCRLYTLPFSESMVTNDDDFTLYLRVCTNTGTCQSIL